MADQYVTAVNPNDVLFGRGSGPNDHEGNIKFRETVSMYKTEYMSTNHRQTKAKIAKTVVESVFAMNGRFLKKLEPAEVEKIGLDAAADIYVVVDDDTVMEKAKQALRQNREKSPKRNSNSPVPPGVISDPVASMGDQLPPSFAAGSGGRFRVPQNSMATMCMFPDAMDQSDDTYEEDVDGYATYTTALDDPEDSVFFGQPRRISTGGPRRSSLLGGRRDGGSRRDSIQMADVWRSRDSIVGGKVGESMHMSDLMESFKGMSATGMNSSTDTIGTIEGEVFGKSHMSLSAMSVNSTLSFFKSPSSDKLISNDSTDTFGGLDSEIWDQQGHQQQDMPAQNDTSARPLPVTSNTGHRESLIPKESWSASTLQRIMQGPLESSSAVMTMETSSGENLHPPDSLGHFGASSMSILRSVDEDYHGNEITDDQDDEIQRNHYTSSD